MYVKIHTKPKGIPAARVIVAPGTLDSGAHQVTVFISALDSHGIPTMATSLRLSREEAQDLARRLVEAAGAS